MKIRIAIIIFVCVAAQALALVGFSKRGTAYVEQRLASNQFWEEPNLVIRDRVTAAQAGQTINLLAPPAHAFTLGGLGGSKLRYFLKHSAAGGDAGIRVYVWDAPIDGVYPMGQLVADVTLDFSGALCQNKHPITQAAIASSNWYEASEETAAVFKYDASGFKVSATAPAGSGSLFHILDVLAGHTAAIEPYGMTASTEIIIAAKRIQ